MSKVLHSAEKLAAVGFAVHWLHPKSKRPIGNFWSDAPVNSVQDLRDTHRVGMNVGIRLGVKADAVDYYLYALDLDIRDESQTDEAKERLSLLLPDVTFTDLACSQTGSGGQSRHFFFLSTKLFRSKKLAHSDGFSMVWDQKKGRDVKKWDWEIELFGEGKQVAIPPSIHPDTGLPYRWITPFDLEAVRKGKGPTIKATVVQRLTDIAPAPDPLAADDERNQPLGLTIEEAKEVVFDLPYAEWCEDRDGWLQVGMGLHHEFGGSREAFKLWCEFSRRSKKFDEREQKTVWRSFKGADRVLRMATLMSAVKEARIMAAFDDESDEDVDDLLGEPIARVAEPAGRAERDDIDDLLEDEPGDLDERVTEGDISKRQAKLNKAKVEDDLGHVPPRIKKLNKKYAVARINGRTTILDFTIDGMVNYTRPKELHDYYENIRVATDKSTEPVTKMWMRHKGRREYPKGVVFSPGKEIPGAFNLWRGYSVLPNPKMSCERFLEHCRRIICSRNDELYQWFIRSIAHMVQHPQDKPGFAWVFRGRKGVGKDTVGDYLAEILGNQAAKIAQQEHLTGRFNQHIQNAMMVHLEEAYWAGSKSAEGALKSLITSPRILIEPKGLTPFWIDSFHRFLITSNENWVVPATADERRFFVLDVSEEMRGNRRYFDALHREMKNGGPSALLHHLMNIDLTGFNIRDVPATAALGNQKIHGLRNIEAWWYGCIGSGDLGLRNNGFGEEDDVDDWDLGGIDVTTTSLREAYEGWLRGRHYHGERIGDVEFARRMRRMLPSVEKRRTLINGSRSYLYRIPRLNRCRAEFQQFIGSEILWSEGMPATVEDNDDDDDLLG